MKTAALFDQWMGIVKSVEGDLTSAAEKMAVRNPDSALEAALWIRSVRCTTCKYLAKKKETHNRILVKASQ